MRQGEGERKDTTATLCLSLLTLVFLYSLFSWKLPACLSSCVLTSFYLVKKTLVLVLLTLLLSLFSFMGIFPCSVISSLSIYLRYAFMYGGIIVAILFVKVCGEKTETFSVCVYAISKCVLKFVCVQETVFRICVCVIIIRTCFIAYICYI